MFRQQTIQVTLEWIEKKLESPISIDDVAKKTGYSRRNIQLLFKATTGMPLGAYIRRRKLCRAAMFVRLTSMPMCDIALLLHFDSQQSFSREFKKLFGCAPREYRNRDYWDLASICPSWLTNRHDQPKCRIVTLDEITFFGHRFSYNTLIQDVPSDEEINLRRNQFAKDLSVWKKDLYCMSCFQASPYNVNAVLIETCSGVLSDNSSPALLNKFTFPKGRYALFHYEGDWKKYARFTRRIYMETLPAEGLVRVNGYDLEVFSFAKLPPDELKDRVVCDLYVPVRYKNSI